MHISVITDEPATKMEIVRPVTAMERPVATENNKNN